MGSISVSLDNEYTKKAEAMRDKFYPGGTVDDAVKAALRDLLDGKFIRKQVKS